MLWLFSFEKTLIMQCPHLRRYPTCQGTIAPVGQRAQPTEHHLAIQPALHRNNLARFESPSQLHFGHQDARVSSLTATIRFREDPHVVSPFWGNSLCARTRSSAVKCHMLPPGAPTLQSAGSPDSQGVRLPSPLDKRTSPKMAVWGHSPERTTA